MGEGNFNNCIWVVVTGALLVSSIGLRFEEKESESDLVYERERVTEIQCERER